MDKLLKRYDETDDCLMLGYATQRSIRNEYEIKQLLMCKFSDLKTDKLGNTNAITIDRIIEIIKSV